MLSESRASDYNLDHLAATEVEVAHLRRSVREERVWELMVESELLLDEAIEFFVTGRELTLAGVVALFSGGNDSTVLAHLLRHRLTHAAHANTGVGVEATRQFVRETCAAWGLPLLERRAPHDRDTYRAMVLDQGFPGPGHHYKMYQRLKERALEQIRNEVVARRTRSSRVVFLAGRRRQESSRRQAVPEFERTGSVVWVSPMVNWTKIDLNTYRTMFEVPRNEVSDLIHMSGECLCGSFAKENERQEIGAWFPGAFEEIAELEAILRGPGYEHIPVYKKTWGWGWEAEHLKASRRRPPKTGALCTSCDARSDVDQQEPTVVVDEGRQHHFESRVLA